MNKLRDSGIYRKLARDSGSRPPLPDPDTSNTKQQHGKKNINPLYLLEEQIRVESVPHVLKHHTFICARRDGRKRNFVCESPKISVGFLQSIIDIWLFSNSKTALCTVLKYQITQLQFCNSLDRCLSFTF